VTAATGNPRLPLVDLDAQHRGLRTELDAAIARVFGSSQFILGEEVDAFETAFARYCGADHAIGCGNGTDALELALWAVGVGAGDEVITVAHTFAATAEAIVRCGAAPVFVDVRDDTLLMDLDAVEAAITPRTRALVPVHLYGSCVDMAPLIDMARRHRLRVVEDAAQAHGATTTAGGRAGAAGDAGCFSFYPGKNLGACGDAGAVVTSDIEIAQRVRAARDHGRSGKYEHAFAARNSRMDGIQGAILGVKLGRLDAWNARRRDLAAGYRARLAAVPAIRAVAVPDGVEPVHHLFVVRLRGRDRVRDALAAAGIATGVHYPIPLHRQPAFASLPDARLPVTEAAAGEILSLPIFPEMTETDLDRVVEELSAVMAG
jgi:dTDP-4-amino-4,6-dideoxygalactose transaminase